MPLSHHISNSNNSRAVSLIAAPDGRAVGTCMVTFSNIICYLSTQSYVQNMPAPLQIAIFTNHIYLGVLSFSGGTKFPKHMFSRIVIIPWWFVAIIISAIFSGNLVARLSITRAKSPVDTLEDLILHGEYNVSINGGGSTEQAFRVSVLYNVSCSR